MIAQAGGRNPGRFDNLAMRVFISYTNEDRDKVQSYLDSFVRNGIDFWLDREQICFGENIVMKIEQGLRDCDCAVLFISADYLAKPWTQAEQRAFTHRMIQEGNVRLIVVSLDGSSMPPLLAPLLWSGGDSEELSGFLRGAHGGVVRRDPLNNSGGSAVVDDFVSTLSDQILLSFSRAFLEAFDKGAFTRSRWLDYRIRKAVAVVEFILPLPDFAVYQLRASMVSLGYLQRHSESLWAQLAKQGLGVFTSAYEIHHAETLGKIQAQINEIRELLDSMILETKVTPQCS